MTQLSTAREKSLQFCIDSFRSDSGHPSYMEWKPEAYHAGGIYDGSGQWDEISLAALAKRKQKPLTANIMQGFVDSLLGVEVQTRHRAAVRSSSDDPEDEKLALALTAVNYSFQEEQRIPYKRSQKTRDMFIYGLGWSNIFYENDKCFYEHVSPFNIVPDMDDLSPQLTNMRRVHRIRYMSPDKMVALWPHCKNYIDYRGNVEKDFEYGAYSPELSDMRSNLGDYSMLSPRRTSVIPVIETQYKSHKKAFKGVDNDGRYFETFDWQTAVEIAESKRDIEEFESERILRTIFTGDFLLEHSPLVGDIPGRQDFSYIPAVFKRKTHNGVFYGIIKSGESIQIDCNVRLTKAVYLVNSQRLIVKGMPQGTNVENFRTELQKQDGVILLPSGVEFEISSNAPLGDEQIKIVHEYINLLQRITGVNDEMLGFQTNATSAVSQEVRTNNALRKNIPFFDTLKECMTRETLFSLETLQGVNQENILARITTPEKTETIILNLTRTVGGKKVVFNNVRTFPLSLYTEEVPDWQSSFDEENEKLQAILNNPNADVILSSPYLLKTAGGLRDAERIAQEIQASMQNKAMMEQGGMPQAMPQGAPQIPNQ